MSESQMHSISRDVNVNVNRYLFHLSFTIVRASGAVIVPFWRDIFQYIQLLPGMKGTFFGSYLLAGWML